MKRGTTILFFLVNLHYIVSVKPMDNLQRQVTEKWNINMESIPIEAKVWIPVVESKIMSPKRITPSDVVTKALSSFEKFIKHLRTLKLRLFHIPYKSCILIIQCLIRVANITPQTLQHMLLINPHLRAFTRKHRDIIWQAFIESAFPEHQMTSAPVAEMKYQRIIRLKRTYFDLSSIPSALERFDSFWDAMWNTKHSDYNSNMADYALWLDPNFQVQKYYTLMRNVVAVSPNIKVMKLKNMLPSGLYSFARSIIQKRVLSWLEEINQRHQLEYILQDIVSAIPFLVYAKLLTDGIDISNNEHRTRMMLMLHSASEFETDHVDNMRGFTTTSKFHFSQFLFEDEDIDLSWENGSVDPESLLRGITLIQGIIRNIEPNIDSLDMTLLTSQWYRSEVAKETAISLCNQGQNDIDTTYPDDTIRVLYTFTDFLDSDWTQSELSDLLYTQAKYTAEISTRPSAKNALNALGDRLPLGWKVMRNKDGVVMYHDYSTGQSTNIKPTTTSDSTPPLVSLSGCGVIWDSLTFKVLKEFLPLNNSITRITIKGNGPNVMFEIESQRKFKTLLSLALQSEKNQIVDLSLFDNLSDKEGHANILIIEPVSRQVHRWDPNGGKRKFPSLQDMIPLSQEQGRKITEIIRTICTEVGYVYHDTYHCVSAPHTSSYRCMRKLGVIGSGFCALWSFLFMILYLEARTSYQDLEKRMAKLLEREPCFMFDLFTKLSNTCTKMIIRQFPWTARILIREGFPRLTTNEWRENRFEMIVRDLKSVSFELDSEDAENIRKEARWVLANLGLETSPLDDRPHIFAFEYQTSSLV